MRLLLVTWRPWPSSLILALIFAAPLEEAANPMVTPNPAKAPWYFLGLQELVGYSALMGGVIMPGIVVIGLALIPFLDGSRRASASGSPTAREALGHRRLRLRRWPRPVCLRGQSPCCFPMRSLFSGIESQVFFDLVNPATLLLALLAGLYFAVLKISVVHALRGDRHVLRLHRRLRPADLHRHGAARTELGLLLAVAGVAGSPGRLSF